MIGDDFDWINQNNQKRIKIKKPKNGNGQAQTTALPATGHQVHPEPSMVSMLVASNAHIESLWNPGESPWQHNRSKGLFRQSRRRLCLDRQETRERRHHARRLADVQGRHRERSRIETTRFSTSRCTFDDARPSTLGFLFEPTRLSMGRQDVRQDLRPVLADVDGRMDETQRKNRLGFFFFFIGRKTRNPTFGRSGNRGHPTARVHQSDQPSRQRIQRREEFIAAANGDGHLEFHADRTRRPQLGSPTIDPRSTERLLHAGLSLYEDDPDNQGWTPCHAL